jgi:hypothetical protein
MPADLRSLLDDAAGAPASAPDVDALATAGLRRRRRARAVQGGSALAVLVVLGLVASSVLTDLRPGPVVLDSPPRPGVGAWEEVPDAPLEPAEGAHAVDLGDGTVLVVGGRVLEPGRGEGGSPQAARFDLGSRTWTALPDVPLTLDREDTLNAATVEVVPSDDGTVAVWRRWTATEAATVQAAVLDPATAIWTATGSAPLSPRSDPLVAWVDGRLLVWGGTVIEPPRPLGEAPTLEEAMGPGDVRTPASGGASWTPERGWQPLPDGPLAPRLDAATLVHDGTLVVWGGATAGVDSPDRRLLGDGAVYDVAAGRWTALPASGLAPRTQAALVPDGGGYVVVGGTGEVAVVETRESERPCTPDEGACDRTSSIGRTYDYETLSDGARFADGRWTPLPPLPEGAEGASAVEDPIAGTVAEAYVDGTTWRWEDGAWAARPTFDVPDERGDWLREHVLADGRVAGVWSTSMGSAPRRLGGAVLGEGGWEAMAEAATPGRIEPAVTGVGGAAIFVWGGSSRVPDEPLDSPRAFARHRDGAVWRP